MSNYYISFSAEQEYTAWYKAIVDVEYFLNSMEFKPIPIQSCIKNMENCLRTFIEKEKELAETGIILLQYPRILFEGLDLSKFIHLIKSTYKNYRLVALVHDLDSIRFGNFFTTNYLAEAPTLNKFDYVIAVNDAMSSLLKSHKVVSEISSLTLFDYALPDIDNTIMVYDPSNVTIAYAGNLKYEKSPFIYHLDKVIFKSIKINLYGPGINNVKFHPSKNIKYKGAFPATDLPNQIKDDFGLCWDGIYLNKCGGIIGQYLKYTNSHKTSLYLGLGLPIIISKDIATAAFVEREHVGIIIESLYDIPSVLNNLSRDEYKSLKQNALRISEKLRNGYYIKKAINDIEKSIKS